MRVGEFLVIRGLVTAEEAEIALQRQSEQGGRLGYHLAAMGAISAEELSAVLPGLQRWQAMHGPNHPQTHRARYSYARALLAAGRAADSLRHAEAALIGHLEALGEKHAWTGEVSQLVAEARHAVAAMQNDTHPAVGG